MRKSNRLQFEAETLQDFNNPFRLISRVDTDCLFGGFTADDAGVLLEGRDGDLFDNHWFVLCSLCSPFAGTRIITTTKYKEQSNACKYQISATRHRTRFDDHRGRAGVDRAARRGCI